jgi:eukaryotic-like serine/threonine-protein kinase
MTPERSQQIRIVIGELETTPENERAALLDRLCSGDPDLRREVEHLLSDSAMTKEATRSLAPPTALLALDTQHLQERFGHYRIVRKIGGGGMGAVYEAVRADDFHKRVALKIIRQEFDSAVARARFQQERQVLANLEHPFIARMLDGGESEDGSPYLVMELVQGEPLHKYAAKLDRAGRLRLFLKVCEAVEYAHRNLVVHRDLKPGNILVTPSGDPKLLDFGIAKLLDSGATRTETGFSGLTPDYASPEQVRGLPITTASDVYSLGVILYELLTGRRPYTLQTAAPMEMDRIICEQPPTAPGLGDELDHIILMALRKEPSRRYGSVQQLAEDIQRSMQNLPVSARPDTFWYRTGKYARRHWAGLISVGIAVAGLLVGSVLAVQQARRAERRFTQVRTIAGKFLFDFHDDIQYIPGTTKAREHMVSTARDYLDSLAAEAGYDPQLLLELATAYQRLAGIQGQPHIANLGQTGPALDSYKKAIAILEKLAARNRTREVLRRLANVYTLRAELLQFISRPKEALASATHASQLSEELLSKPTVEQADYTVAATAVTDLGSLRMAVDDLSEARTDYGKAVEYRRRAVQAYPNTETRYAYAAALEHAGYVLMRLGDLAGALDRYHEEEKIVDILSRDNPSDVRFQRLRLLLYQNLGNVYGTTEQASLGQRSRALGYYRQMQALAQEMYTADPNNQTALSDLINSLVKSANVISQDTDPLTKLELDQRALALTQKLAAGPQRDYHRIASLNGIVEADTALRDFSAAHRALDGFEALVRNQTGNLAVQSNQQRNLALVYERQAELALKEHKLDVALLAASNYLKYMGQRFADHPESMSALADLSEAWDLMTLIYQQRADGAQIRAWRQKKLDAWTDWNRRHTPNPYSKAQQEEAASALTTADAGTRTQPQRH